MTRAATRVDATRVIARVLANDYGCNESDFARDGIVVTEFAPRQGGRGFQPSPFPLQAVTLGTGVVASCHAEFLPEVRALADESDRDGFFSAPTIARLHGLVAARGEKLNGPHLKYACSLDRFRPVVGGATPIETIADEAVLAYANAPGFPHALTVTPGRFGSRFLAALGRDGERLIAVAAACEEADGLWQIGVDVLAEARGRGLGAGVVSRVTEAIFARGDVPYYTIVPSNIASRSTAVSLGFWPAWTELYATM